VLIIVYYLIFFFLITEYLFQYFFQTKAARKRKEHEQFRSDLILKFAEHLPVPEDKFKNSLLRYHYFIKLGARVDFHCCTPIDGLILNRVMALLPKQYLSSPFLPVLKERFLDVSKYLVLYIITVRI